MGGMSPRGAVALLLTLALSGCDRTPTGAGQPAPGLAGRDAATSEVAPSFTGADVGSAPEAAIFDAVPDMTTPLPLDAGTADAGAARLSLDRGTAFFAAIDACPADDVRFRVSNSGTAPSGPLQVTLTRSFTLAADGCSGRSLAPGERCELVVRFVPQGPAHYPGTLRVSAGAAADEARLTGLAPVIEPPYYVEPNLVDFAAVKVGSARKVALGVRALGAELSNLAVDTTSPDFVLTRNACGGTIPSGGRCELELSFNPTTPGAKSGLLRVKFPTACSNHERAAMLAGTAVDQDLVLAPNQARFDPPSTGCSGLPAPQRFQLTNVGSVALPALVIELTGEFRIAADGCGGRSLEPGASCELEVRLDARSAGMKTGILRARAGGQVVEASLAGTGAPSGPWLELTPPVLDFGVRRPGTTTPLTARATVPRLAAPVSNVTVSLSSSFFSLTRNGCAGLTLQPGEGCELEVAFHTTTVGRKSTLLILDTGSPCTQQRPALTLQGVGMF
jgi:hypothetical protein